MKKEELEEMRAKVSKAKKLEEEIERINEQLDSLGDVVELQLNFPKSRDIKSWHERKSQNEELIADIVSDVRSHLESKLESKERELRSL